MASESTRWLQNQRVDSENQRDGFQNQRIDS